MENNVFEIQEFDMIVEPIDAEGCSGCSRCSKGEA